MRLKACKDAGIKMVWVDVAEGWTEEQKKEFIVKDNVGFGDWDWDAIANEWEEDKLDDWGLDVWQSEEKVDYSILDDDDLSEELDELSDGVRKAIQIDFDAKHYEEASELVKHFRNKKTYVGGLILKYLREEKK
jgi:ABC-type sugar transport system substrate-binding protein